MDPADSLTLRDKGISIQAIRAQGAGGQHVNKVSSAIHLRFDIRASGLSAALKQRLLARQDQRISADGIIVLKAQRFRRREQNLDDALVRLRQIIREASHVRTKRIATRPSMTQKKRRLTAKRQQANKKAQRGKPRLDD
ncbi:MAG TPA: aminoacyl-tRNA hydrolase [Gammaproteobacteria bacterium]|jgi:ribosome-associated protein|nr:aminoacyl-tRNA hydrolase [Gammaproteobacteria bacterium]